MTPDLISDPGASFASFFGFYGSHIGEMIQSFDEHIFNMAGEHISRV